ncbi:helix-turn-helix domain-containing protein [Hathewaya histolytica]|uniref:Transcriptional regulatory protein n=1 Tax=Hathewaya histolytica TaxID=1498 RepID=A0A4U9RN10_HATHI|nr:helix-turn-helix domain-containing protein [Hathewaya histolytica]VTQ93389.1 transcriptional regulatory protein [Hathewaya histolytica]
MRNEYITYNNNLPIKVELVNIKEYPIHWHDSIEVLMVLQGNITVTIESGTYTVSEKEVEIINVEEAHRIFSEDDNKVLMFHLDPNFFKRYYDDIRNMFFYTDTSDKVVQHDEKYQVLRKYLAIMLCEFVQKGDDYDEYIEETMIELLYHLINNFHYLMYEKEELRENEVQLERYHRIIKYIYNNYDSKITLQDIAKKEFLSSHYLSHEIKNTMGLSFKEFVNLTRVEESIKLLLDTDMTISEISQEVGFSHSRYYNKNFKIHYKMTPMQFRKKYKIDEDKLEELRDIKYYDLKEALEELSIYLEDYDRFSYEDRLIKLSIDASKNSGSFNKEFKEDLVLPKAWEVKNQHYMDQLRYIQKEIGFEYGKIGGWFSEEMGIFSGNSFINLSNAMEVIEFILSIELRPHIILKEDIGTKKFGEFLVKFIEFFIDKYGSYEVGKWKYSISNKLPEETKEELLKILGEYGLKVVDENIKEDNNPIYDTSYMLPYIIHKIINEKNIQGINVMDHISLCKDAKNEVFWGGKSLLNWQGIKKPSYYAYYYLSRLGDIVVEKGDGYIVTSKGDKFQVILYNYDDTMEEIIDFNNLNKLRGKRNAAQKNISLNIKNLSGSYRITIYEVSEKLNTFYSQWLDMGSPKRIEEEEKKIISIACQPRIKFVCSKKNIVHHLGIKIKGYGAVLIEFIPINVPKV